MSPQTQLDPPAQQALGKLSPQDAWTLIVDKATTALELDPEKCEELAQELNLLDQPDDPLKIQDLSDLQEVIVGLDPVAGINHFHYMNPELNLQTIPDEPPLKVLRAVMLIFSQSDRWASTHGD